MNDKAIEKSPETVGVFVFLGVAKITKTGLNISMETTNLSRLKMGIEISQEAYEKYRTKKNLINNTRLRPENEDIFDALMSVDMTATPEGRDILEAIRKLN